MKKTLDSNAIKLVAIAAMTVDHVAWWLFPGYPRAVLPLAMHIIGRLTCPIMCYFVAEGYHHTRDIRKYTARMFLFAVISHFAYVFASADFAGWRSFIPFSSGSVLNQTSVMWSLAWGLVMLRVVHDRRLRPAVQVALILLICLVSFPADWSCIAALCIMAFGTNRGKLKTQALWMMFYVALYAVVYALALDWVYGLVQLAVVLAVPVLALYNGQRGPSPRPHAVMKWLFYLPASARRLCGPAQRHPGRALPDARGCLLRLGVLRCGHDLRRDVRLHSGPCQGGGRLRRGLRHDPGLLPALLLCQ